MVMKLLATLSALICLSLPIPAKSEAPQPFVSGTLVPGHNFFRHEIEASPAGRLRFYLAPVEAGQRPLLLLVQGSGCEPLFIDGDGGLSPTAGQDIIQHFAAERFAVLIVEKPHVASESPTRNDGTTDACAAEFNRHHSLDHWAAAISSAIDAALGDPAVDRAAGVRIIGMSEGAIVAARVARNRGDVRQLAFISGFGCNQWRDMLVVARRNAPPDLVEQSVLEMEAGFREVAADPSSTTRFFEGQTHLFWSTFGLACPAQDLLQSSATPLIAFGTADEQVDANGMESIVAEFLATGRPIVVKRILGGSHVLDTPDTEPFENLVGVFAFAIDWMTGEAASP